MPYEGGSNTGGNLDQFIRRKHYTNTRDCLYLMRILHLSPRP